MYIISFGSYDEVGLHFVITVVVCCLLDCIFVFYSQATCMTVFSFSFFFYVQILPNYLPAQVGVSERRCSVLK